MASDSQATGVSTRKRARAVTPEQAPTPEPSMEAVTLQAAMREIRELREERLRMRADFEAQLQERDSEFRRLEERRRQEHFLQLSPSNNSDVIPRERNELGYKLKPDNYDGSVPLREFITQFNFVARANAWADSAKTIALATCLRGKARSALDGIFEIENLRFEELISK